MDLFGKSCGVALTGNVGWVCVTEKTLDASPFTELMLFTGGFLVIDVLYF